MTILKEQVRDLLAAAGMQETVSYSATSLETLAGVAALVDHPQPVKIANPMSGELEYLRTSLRGSVLETLASNRRISQGGSIRLFEIGRVYLPKEEAKDRDLPDENEMLVGVLSGPRFTTSWQSPEGDLGFFDAKGVLQSVFAKLGIDLAYKPHVDSTLHPGKAARLMFGETPVGVIGELHPSVLERFDLGAGPVAMFEVELESLKEIAQRPGRGYRTASRFPESHRDLALILDASVPSDAVQAIIESNRLVVNSIPFDVYSGDGVAAGKKSVAYRVVYQSDSATLTSEQVDKAQQDILRRLRHQLGAELRS
jgi:phenylalanyl-tRNA synthetase beta chain